MAGIADGAARESESETAAGEHTGSLQASAESSTTEKMACSGLRGGYPPIQAVCVIERKTFPGSDDVRNRHGAFKTTGPNIWLRSR
jgi:hypothetical protein